LLRWSIHFASSDGSIEPKVAPAAFGIMPLYFFSVRNGEHAGVCDEGAEFPDRVAAWQELTEVCGDMVGGISRNLGENAEWAVELLDESRKPVFRIRLIAETLD